MSLSSTNHASNYEIFVVFVFQHLLIIKHKCKEPPSSLQSPLSKIQTKPLYISTEGPATHFWDWAKPNIYTILYSTQMNYWWTYGEDQGVFVAMDE